MISKECDACENMSVTVYDTDQVEYYENSVSISDKVMMKAIHAQKTAAESGNHISGKFNSR